MFSHDSVPNNLLDNQEQDVVSEYTIGSSDTSTAVSSRASSLGSCTHSGSVTHLGNMPIHPPPQDHGEEMEPPIGSSTPDFSYTDSSPNAHALSDYSPDELVYPPSDAIAHFQPPSDHRLSGPGSEDASLFLECLDRLLRGVQRRESRLSSSDNSTNDERGAELLDEYLVSGWDATRTTSGSHLSSSSGLPGNSGRQSSLRALPATAIKRKLYSIDLANETTHLAAEDTCQQSSSRSLSSFEALDDISSRDSRTSSKRRKLSQVSSVLTVTVTGSVSVSVSGLTQSQLATEPATLRKAHSLRSDASIRAPASQEVRSPDTNQAELSTACLNICDDYGCIATEPVTPVVSRPVSPLPIPLPEDIPRAPLCSVEEAERRLCALLRREECERAQAYLPTTRVRYSEDIKRVMTDSDTSEEDSCVSQDEDGESTCNGRCEDGTSQDQDFRLDIRDDLRTEAMNWILTVVPPYDLPSHIRKPNVYSKDLYEQLLQHPDTRFLAAYIFGRYFLAWKSGDSGCTTPYLPASPSVHNAQPIADVQRCADLEDGERRLVWDFALAAIVLSVKIQRDFLPPLRPIYIRDFLVLAPHETSHDDLEAAQRDMLHALSYCISIPTPESYFEEVYSALPALRQLAVALGGCAGWDAMRKHMWARLLAAAQEPDLYRFPISVLVAAAFQRSISFMLVRHEGRQLGQFQEKADGRCASQILINQRRIGPVSRLAWGVQQDIQNILQAPQVLLDECKRWLSPLRFQNSSGQDWFDHASST